MHPEHPWLRVIHAACCDRRRLEEIVADELQRASVVRILGAAARGDPLQYWSEVAGAVGSPADLRRYGAADSWMDLGFEPNGRACARPGEVAQPLHNDEASVPALAGTVGLFHAARHAPGGGRLLFLDAGAAAAAACRRDPHLHDRLMSVPLRFGRVGGEVRETPVLRVERGRLKVAWNEFRILPEQSDAGFRLRHDLRAFLQDLVLGGEAAAAPMGAGDVVFFRADEALHGREAPLGRGAVAPLISKSYWRASNLKALRAA